MTQATQTAAAAQDTLRHISETERGERARRAAAGALVLQSGSGQASGALAALGAARSMGKLPAAECERRASAAGALREEVEKLLPELELKAQSPARTDDDERLCGCGRSRCADRSSSCREYCGNTGSVLHDMSPFMRAL